MAKCPVCKEDIDRLDSWSKEWVQRSFALNVNGSGEYEAANNMDDCGEMEFRCLACGETVATDEETAIKFLRGED